jgi:poly [ADP-ribose] polymerase 10/14/15
LLPKIWTKMNENELYRLVQLKEGSPEYIQVSTNFKGTGKIIRIERIQNPRLHKQYEVHRDYLLKKNGNENEKILFHGTASKNTESICKFGFNRSYCGINGVALGRGVYFARESSTSHSYTQGSSHRQMFQCRVLVGDSTPGNSAMNVPPNKINGEPYDSTCDFASSGSVYVCYNDNQCYPEYLISYM